MRSIASAADARSPRAGRGNAGTGPGDAGTGPGDSRAKRGLVLAALAVLLGLFAVGLVEWARHGTALLGGWTAPPGRTAAEVRAGLADWGLPVVWWIGLFLLLEVLLVAVSAAAAYVVLRGTLSWFRIYLAFVLVLFATAGGGVPLAVAEIHPAVAGPATLLQGVAWIALFPLAYVFPDGRFVPRWSRWLVLAWFTVLVVGPVLGPAEWVLLLALFGSAAGAGIYRYVKVSGPVERQQTKWVVLALGLRFGFNVLLAVTPIGGLQEEPGRRGLTAYAAVMVVSYVLAALLPVAVAVAVVRHRLFDVDVVISRTLAFGVLTGLVVAVYAGAVAAVGALWPADRFVGPLVAAGVVAVGFNPVRARVQRRVNRLVYGERDDPYAVLSGLGRQLATAVGPDRVASTIVDTVRSALRVPYAAVVLGDPPAVVAETGRRPDGGVVEFPVAYQGSLLGVLRVGGADGADRRLLADLAGQCGAALAAADEAARTRALAADLQHTREQLVTAREEERRRIRRDLHDSLGPAIGAQTLTIDTARALMATEPAKAEALLRDLKGHSQELLSDVRRLARDLRPPALDEVGLADALRQLAGEVDVGELPPLTAAAEVALYRIAQEAMTNVARHASARTCTVSLTADADRLVLVVEDDGAGIPAGTRSGVGFASMRERAEELGGDLRIGPADGGGTRVVATFPLTVAG